MWQVWWSPLHLYTWWASGTTQGLGQPKVSVLVNKYGLLLKIEYVTSYNSMPISPPFTEVDDSNQSLIFILYKNI